MADETPAAPPAPATPVSPTGQAIIPPALVKWMAPICLVAGMVAMEGPEMGLAIPAAVMPWVKFVWVLGTVLGIVSPGARTRTPS